MKEIDPIICFDSVQTLRQHLKALKPDTEVSVTPNDFTRGRQEKDERLVRAQRTTLIFVQGQHVSMQHFRPRSNSGD